MCLIIWLVFVIALKFTFLYCIDITNLRFICCDLLLTGVRLDVCAVWIVYALCWLGVYMLVICCLLMFVFPVRVLKLCVKFLFFSGIAFWGFVGWVSFWGVVCVARDTFGADLRCSFDEWFGCGG